MKMGTRGGGVFFLAVLVLVCILARPVAGTLQDGRPRPTGFPDIPSKAYGPTPPCYLNGVAVTCQWYGFAHINYPTNGALCMQSMRNVLSNTTLVEPGELRPYIYYFSSLYVFDPSTNATYCYYGCFNLGESATAPPPSTGFAPPPSTGFAPPPLTLEPPPATPPPTLAAPPPATLFPPPVANSPPPPTPRTPPPVASTPSPPGSVLTPPPGETRIINLNGAGFLQPTGLLSIFLSAVALIFHGLAAL